MKTINEGFKPVQQPPKSSSVNIVKQENKVFLEDESVKSEMALEEPKIETKVKK